MFYELDGFLVNSVDLAGIELVAASGTRRAMPKKEIGKRNSVSSIYFVEQRRDAPK